MTSDLGFSWTRRKSGDVVIERHGTQVTTLRGPAALRFIARIAEGDPQQLMARATGNYKRGNERG